MSEENKTEGLKLLAQSAEGLAVISAALQDAIVRVGGIRFDAPAQTLTLIASRYRHELGEGKRVRAGLRLNNILSMQAKGIDRSDPEAFLVLLSITFEAGENAPEGIISLIFAGGGELRARADFTEVRLVDYLETRATQSRPIHPG